VHDQTVYRQALNVRRTSGWRTLAIVLMIFCAPRGRWPSGHPRRFAGRDRGHGGAGRTINVISLAGMAFAIGMVLDNAIVI
jgi:hypothetical protein